MDGEVDVHFLKPAQPLVPASQEGTVRLPHQPAGQSMGWVRARRGHMALLPKGSAYQFRNSGRPAVLLVQTIQGPETVERWSDICQTAQADLSRS
jgi:hypothetical protein